jgi:hypothetical protein
MEEKAVAEKGHEMTSAKSQRVTALRLAEASPRCAHVRRSGVRCGSPARRGQPFCYYHTRFYEFPDLEFPALEDAPTIQMAIQQVLEELRRDRLDARKAGVMLYGLQTAGAMLGRRGAIEPDPNALVAETAAEAMPESERAAKKPAQTVR